MTQEEKKRHPENHVIDVDKDRPAELSSEEREGKWNKDVCLEVEVLVELSVGVYLP